MNDKELTTLAYKAAFGGAELGDDKDMQKRWHPLTDDGDAMRLAVKLGICFGQNFDGDMAVAFGDDGRNITEMFAGDKYAATRRAIVRAAAEIGKAMP